jgi:hypothetical protein
MVLQTLPSSSYTRIKDRRKSKRFTFQKGPKYKNLFDKDILFSSPGHIEHFWKPTKGGKPFSAYHFKDLLVESTYNRYHSFYPLHATLEPPEITHSLPSVVTKRLQHLGRLPDGWDSYSAKPIDDKTIKSALSLLTRISSDFGLQLTKNVSIAPCSDGGIQLEWELNSKELIVKIAPDDEQLSFLLVLPSGDEEEDSIASKAQLDNLLQEILRP